MINLENIKIMKRTIISISVLILISLSCSRHPDEPVHNSYNTLNSFLKQENLYQTLDIEKVDVDFMSISDTKDFRPDNKNVHSRKLEVTYDFTITGKNKVYLSRATIASKDSVAWQMKTLVLKEKADSTNTVTEKIYTWDLSKNPIKSVSVTKLTKS